MAKKYGYSTITLRKNDRRQIVRACSAGRSFNKMKRLSVFLLIVGLIVAACASYQEYAAERTARLRQMYPPGMSKEDVQAKWGDTRQDFSSSRPSQGWAAYPNDYIANKLGDRETVTGKRIEFVDRYWGPDGFLPLCYCWYFYDSSGRIVDVEWQYKSV